MAATKTCPSCDADVPVAARRCKTCFHDFDEAPARSGGGPLLLLGALALILALSASTFWYISSLPTDVHILVDEPSRSVQWVRRYQDGHIETERLSFDDVTKLEYVITDGGDFQVVAITQEGGRRIISENANTPLRTEAERYAGMMERPLDIVDNTLGLGN